MILKTKNITKKYNKKTVLENINIEIDRNTVYGFIGPNGAGKTTLLGILSSLILPTQGEVYLFDKNLNTEKKYVEKDIGLLAHETNFYLNSNPLNNLVFYARLNGYKKGEAINRSKKALEQVGLIDEIYTPVSSLSNGMKKQLGIAQAILHDPKILFLDEPFTGLDPQSKVKLKSIINSLKKNMTVLISSHELAIIEKLCKKLAIMKNGKIVADNYMNKLKLKKNQVSLEFNKIDENIKNKLNKIKGLKKLQIDNNSVKLYFDNKQNNIDKVTNFLKKNNMNPISIKQGASIEDIFIEYN